MSSPRQSALRRTSRAARSAQAGVAATAVLTALMLLGVAPVSRAADDEASLAQRAHALLAERCFECHGPEARRPKGGLRLDSREGVFAGGHEGPAAVPGDPEASLLIAAVRRLDDDLAMPPKSVLTDDEVALLVAWVAAGLPWADADVAHDGGARGGDAAGTDDANADAHDGAPASARADAHDDAAEPDLAPPRAWTHDELMFFESKVRPVLIERCGRCHGADAERLKGGLRMAWRGDLLRGGDSGPAIVPGDPDASRLVTAVRYDNFDLQMPPDERLPQHEIDDLVRWVAMDAPWPDGEDPGAPASAHAEPGIDLEAGREWWSFRPVVRPPVPAHEPGSNPIDAFVDAALADAGLVANGPADARTLARRTWFDLVGLPPTEAQLAEFVADASRDASSDAEPGASRGTSPAASPAASRDALPAASPAALPAASRDAHARLVDRLLASPAYGERWARHWLDVVRYAQTDGYEHDAEKPFAWRYRDWVIDALNADMPYDRFLREQLAGDELEQVTDGSLVATGFYRLGTWDSEPDDPRQAEFDELDDIVSTIGSGMLGVTLACARCHDHKFDPFGQDDYYAMVALLRGLAPNDEPIFALDSPTLLPLGLDAGSRQRWEDQRQRRIAELQAEQRSISGRMRREIQAERLTGLPDEVARAWETPQAERTPAQQALLDAHRELVVSAAELSEALPVVDRQRSRELFLEMEQVQRSFQGDLDWALVARDASPWPPPTQVLSRGRASLPGEPVPPRFVRVLCADDLSALPDLSPPGKGAASSGRRRALADWVASESNPLTARVIVNRVWQHHFGRGIVPTPDDFGAAGSPPSHPELLDWLAAELIDAGWSLKHLHRLILSSRAWQRSSSRAGGNAALAEERDPDNALLWRHDLRRLEAEPLRDALVAVAGGLSPERGGRGFFPVLSRESIAGGSRPGRGWQIDLPREQDRRAIYAFVKRSVLPPVLEAFDYTNTVLPQGQRVVTTSVSQAFVLLNGEFVERQAQRLAEGVAAEAGDDLEALVDALFRRVLARAPDAHERALALDYLSAQTADFAALPPVAVFGPRVPTRLDVGFLETLAGRDVLDAPEPGWRVLRGPWGNMYNLTVELDTERGPAALFEGVSTDDLSVDTTFRLGETAAFASLLLRAQAHGAVFTGLELRLDPRERELALLLHADPESSYEAARRPEVLTSTSVSLPELSGVWLRLRVVVDGGRLSASIGAADGDGALVTTLQLTNPRLRGEGGVGLRTWGGALELRDLVLGRDDQRFVVSMPAVAPERRALQSLALTLLNTNEFVFVD